MNFEEYKEKKRELEKELEDKKVELWHIQMEIGFGTKIPTQ